MSNARALEIYFGIKSEAVERASSFVVSDEGFSIRPLVEIKRTVDRDTFFRIVGRAPCYWMIQSPPVESEFGETIITKRPDENQELASVIQEFVPTGLADVIPINSAKQPDAQDRAVHAEFDRAVFSLAGGS